MDWMKLPFVCKFRRSLFTASQNSSVGFATPRVCLRYFKNEERRKNFLHWALKELKKPAPLYVRLLYKYATSTPLSGTYFTYSTYAKSYAAMII